MKDCSGAKEGVVNFVEKEGIHISQWPLLRVALFPWRFMYTWHTKEGQGGNTACLSLKVFA